MLLLFVLVAFAAACHPESTWLCDNPCNNWLCDDPVCPMLCKPDCDVDCVCFNNVTNSSYYNLCTVNCAPDQCEADSCPDCETQCLNPCSKGYEPYCEATACVWDCVPDPRCPKPTCEELSPDQHCEHPLCELQSEFVCCSHSAATRRSIF